MGEALDSTLNGAWSKFTPHMQKDPHEILSTCKAFSDDSSLETIRRIPTQLVLELASLPELFQVLLDMVGDSNGAVRTRTQTPVGSIADSRRQMSAPAGLDRGMVKERGEWGTKGGILDEGQDLEIFLPREI